VIYCGKVSKQVIKMRRNPKTKGPPVDKCVLQTRRSPDDEGMQKAEQED